MPSSLRFCYIVISLHKPKMSMNVLNETVIYIYLRSDDYKNRDVHRNPVHASRWRSVATTLQTAQNRKTRRAVSTPATNMRIALFATLPTYASCSSGSVTATTTVETSQMRLIVVSNSRSCISWRYLSLYLTELFLRCHASIPHWGLYLYQCNKVRVKMFIAFMCYIVIFKVSQFQHGRIRAHEQSQHDPTWAPQLGIY